MTEQQENWFEKLHEKRNNTATTLMNDFAVGKIWNSVVEKYSDQAHFIYELLQNADDARATSARFELFRDRLVFAHNGTRRFTVSNPATETDDLEAGTTFVYKKTGSPSPRLSLTTGGDGTPPL